MPTLNSHDIDAIVGARHGDPFSVLGPHPLPDDRVSFRAFLPGASAVEVLDVATGRLLANLGECHPEGFFEAAGPAPGPEAHCFRIFWRLLILGS